MNTATASTLRNRQGNWIEGTVYFAADDQPDDTNLLGFQVAGLVFEEPSESYGLEAERRISKLWIATDAPPAKRLVLFDYDRDPDGPSTNYLKDDTRDAIIAELIAHRTANPCH